MQITKRLTACLAIAFLLLSAAVATADGPRDIAFPFAPATGDTIVYRVTETEAAALGGSHGESVRWSNKITLTLGQPVANGFDGQLTVSEVKAEDGTPDTLHYLLARSVEGRTIDVTVDRSGYIREITDWPALKAAMAAAFPSLTDPTTVKLLTAALDRVDAETVASAVARPLFLLGAAYNLVFKSDGSLTSYPDWQGGAAYVFPGRTATTHLIGKDGNVVYGEWSLSTDPRAAASHIGDEVLALLGAHAGDDSELAATSRQASALLAENGIDLTEHGAFAFDAATRRMTKFQHDMKLSVGKFLKTQAMTIDLVR